MAESVPEEVSGPREPVVFVTGMQCPVHNCHEQHHFRGITAFTRHWTLVHTNKSVILYVCKRCRKKEIPFTAYNINKFKKHMKIQHQFICIQKKGIKKHIKHRKVHSSYISPGNLYFEKLKKDEFKKGESLHSVQNDLNKVDHDGSCQVLHFVEGMHCAIQGCLVTKNYATFTAFHSHWKVNHINIIRNQYQCSKCLKNKKKVYQSFSRKNIKLHLKKVHGMNYTKQKRKNFNKAVTITSVDNPYYQNPGNVSLFDPVNILNKSKKVNEEGNLSLSGKVKGGEMYGQPQEVESQEDDLLEKSGETYCQSQEVQSQEVDSLEKSGLMYSQPEKVESQENDLETGMKAQAVLPETDVKCQDDLRETGLEGITDLLHTEMHDLTDGPHTEMMDLTDGPHTEMDLTDAPHTEIMDLTDFPQTEVVGQGNHPKEEVNDPADDLTYIQETEEGDLTDLPETEGDLTDLPETEEGDVTDLPETEDGDLTDLPETEDGDLTNLPETRGRSN